MLISPSEQDKVMGSLAAPVRRVLEVWLGQTYYIYPSSPVLATEELIAKALVQYSTCKGIYIYYNNTILDIRTKKSYHNYIIQIILCLMKMKDSPSELQSHVVITFRNIYFLIAIIYAKYFEIDYMFLVS